MFRVLDQLPKGVADQGIRGAAAKAALVVKRESRKIIIDEATDERFFSWSRWFARSIRVKRSRRDAAPGAAVLSDGPDIPLSGRLFTTWKAFRIWAFGAFNIPDRRGHGRFEGFGDPLEQSARQNDPEIRNVFIRNVIPQMQKAGDRLMKRLGKHAK